MKLILPLFFLSIVGAFASSSDDLMLHVIRNDIGALSDVLSSSSEIDVNSTKNRMTSPLLLLSKDEKMTKLLLEHGADVSLGDAAQNMTALMEASRNGNINQAKLLIQAGAVINRKDDYGRTALHYSVGNLNAKFGVYLIELGAFLDAQDFEGNTPLMRAVYHGDHEFVKELIEKGANVRLLNKDELTAAQQVQFSVDEESKAKMVKLFEGASTGSTEIQ